MTGAAFTFVDLFAGIGGFHAALSGMGGRCVYAVEIDRDAAAVYARNWGQDPLGDITQDANDAHVRVPAHDVLAAGFPCQPFRQSGGQRSMDETRGTMYWHVLAIIQARHPTVVLLESVRNLAGPRHAREWEVIIETLRDEGYRVSELPAIFSPHLLPPGLGGRPQFRPRVFITATYDPEGVGHGGSVEPVVDNQPVGGWEPQRWDLERDLPTDAEPGVQDYGLTASERLWIDAWDDFVIRIREERDGKQLPGFPLWADTWLTDHRPAIAEMTPAWKSAFLRMNAEFYTAHGAVIDRWIQDWGVHTDEFPASRRKLEWQASGTPRLWDCVLQFRPSGIRATRPNCLPALVAIGQTAIIGRRGRRLSLREAARLQGLPEWFDFLDQSPAATFKQLGNGVSIGAAWHVLKRHAVRDRDALAARKPRLLDAIESAPDSPDDAMPPRRRTEAPASHLESHLRLLEGFKPAPDKLEAVNRLSSVTHSGPQTLGPGSKEHKSVLIDLATGLGLLVDADGSKTRLAEQIASALDVSWSDECWSSGQTLTLAGLNRLLSGAERRTGGKPVADLPLEIEARRIIQTLASASPAIWDGRTCIEEMREAEDSQWAQDEWKGFYLEFLAGACTSLGGRRNALRYGNTTIDYELFRCWDFKTHSEDSPWAILNDKRAFDACIADRGGLGVVVLSGKREIEGEFRAWQRSYRAEHGRVRRATTKPPTQQRYGTSSFIPRRLEAFYFTESDLERAVRDGTMRVMKPGRQTTSDSPRNAKYQLNVPKARGHLVAAVEFGQGAAAWTLA